METEQTSPISGNRNLLHAQALQNNANNETVKTWATQRNSQENAAQALENSANAATP